MRVPGSFRDPSGFVFRRDDILHRQVNRAYAEHFDALIGSGLYAELVDAGLLVEHAEVHLAEADAPGAYRVLRPRELPFISFAYEWTFGQLRDAALATLEVQQRALARGMVLKDASSFNIQFDRGRPILIDTLSFEAYREGRAWTAYRQFCQHFLAPLLLMSRVDIRLGTLCERHLDGVPLDLASTLLPRSTWLRFSSLLHVHLHARSIRHYAGRNEETDRRALERSFGRTSMLGLVASLQSAIRRIDWRVPETTWSGYTRDRLYADRAVEEKRRIVGEYIGRIKPGTVWDAGANTGEFSRIAADGGAFVVALDADPGAAELHYRSVRTDRANILPLVVDLANPSPAAGWDGRERTSLFERGPADLVLALAVVHHLTIGNNVPLPMVAESFSRIARRAVVEFVPKEDPQVRRLLASRVDVFPEYDREGFEAGFGQFFRIVDRRPIAESERVLYLLEPPGQ